MDDRPVLDIPGFRRCSAYLSRPFGETSGRSAARDQAVEGEQYDRPKVATRMDQMFSPVAPAPPKSPTTNPPTMAPAIPMRMVTMKPPGSSPGITSLPKTPAMSPTMIQLMMPISSTLLS